MNSLPEFSNDELGIDAFPIADERSLARRIALQILYEVDSARHEADQVMAIHLQARQVSEKAAAHVELIVNGVTANRDRLDEAIQQFAPDFPIDQIAIIDRNILRSAIYEFAIDGHTPIGVAINEAVELGKLFGADNASNFINGVLGAMVQKNAYRALLGAPKFDLSPESGNEMKPE